MKFAADSPWLPIRFGIREEPLKFSPNNDLMKFAAGSDGLSAGFVITSHLFGWLDDAGYGLSFPALCDWLQQKSPARTMPCGASWTLSRF